ncbi:hypothetical protein M501DRAFT_232718 [Patellaria atrata CBS 101060]|uniref:Uncharacterized protein n=1 Tax=Patellaria atrata CBS 101060 TaxID=1346257 RepID=A0A9P4S866_9PEZI|nr:hypothetical protein M501DRAFT_232718 [Patellaria atrata CBS 101060]
MDLQLLARFQPEGALFYDRVMSRIAAHRVRYSCLESHNLILTSLFHFRNIILDQRKIRKTLPLKYVDLNRTLLHILRANNPPPLRPPCSCTGFHFLFFYSVARVLNAAPALELPNSFYLSPPVCNIACPFYIDNRVMAIKKRFPVTYDRAVSSDLGHHRINFRIFASFVSDIRSYAKLSHSRYQSSTSNGLKETGFQSYHIDGWYWTIVRYLPWQPCVTRH